MSSSKKTTTTQWTTPYKPTQRGLETSSRLATEGLGNAQEYQGRFNPQTSPFTTGGLASMADLASFIPSNYGRSALDAGEYLTNKIATGGYKPATYDPSAAIESAVRPVVEKYSENLLPNMSAFFTNTGGYQGQNPGGVASTAGDALARNFNREAIQVAGEQAFNAAELNARNLLQGNAAEDRAIGALPAIFAGGLSAAQLYPGFLGQVGAADEAIAGRDIMEALQQNQYHNMYEAGIAGPYQDILMGPAQAFGTTTNVTKQKLDPITQGLQAAASIAGAFMGNPAALGGLFGGGAATGMPANILPQGAGYSSGYTSGGFMPYYGQAGTVYGPSNYPYVNPFGSSSSDMSNWFLY